jgi:hypothetical protein
VRLDAPDDLQNGAARSGQPESPVPQCHLSTLGFRWARIARCPSNSHLRDDSHLQQPRPDESHGTSAHSDCQEAPARRTRRRHQVRYRFRCGVTERILIPWHISERRDPAVTGAAGSSASVALASRGRSG